ncbi:hypothetical protein M231_02636 [Tremella mesenterica]|uniref:DUF159-domain-containing protein n=1 Tax=Tremella mesenterica TaxID=5217 RepID=A0A4Q1BQ00_TREME|nr:hypothetical protein M231_02636 [Tremella mesenterica]
MCGRYALALSNEELYDALQEQLPRMFDHGRPRWERPQDYRPNYNVAPRQRAAVIHRDTESGRAMIETMQWGLIPHWSKHPPSGPLNTINARSETLLDPTSGGMWHHLKGSKRCVVPAQGYYEWLKKPSTKIAHFTRLPLGPKNDNTSPPLIFFAGLYDIVHYKDTREPYPTGNPLPLATFTILTTAPAKDIRWLHDRMPCVLNGWEEVERWLGMDGIDGWVEGKNGTGQMLRGCEGLDCFPVNPEVGKIGTNSPTFIQPVSERSDGIKSFFQKQQLSPSKLAKSSHSSPRSVKKIDSSETSPISPQILEETKDVKPKEEKGLGDDSNAPNPTPTVSPGKTPGVKKEQPTPKRKRQSESDAEEEAQEKPQGRRGGHQTKVVRRTDPEDHKAAVCLILISEER